MKPDTAFVLAAGLGTRMRPLTEKTPKPLIAIAGRTLLDRGLDNLAASGVRRCVINVHWLGQQIIDHAKSRRDMKIQISDESDSLLDSGGGIAKALPLLGDNPFFILNADTFWVGDRVPALASLAAEWNDRRMDMCLLLADPQRTTGHGGGTDFTLDVERRIARGAGAAKGFIYAGAGLLHPRIFSNAPDGRHSLNWHFDRLIGEGRLFGHVLDGHWITVGTPDAIAPAQEAVERHSAD